MGGRQPFGLTAPDSTTVAVYAVSKALSLTPSSMDSLPWRGWGTCTAQTRCWQDCTGDDGGSSQQRELWQQWRRSAPNYANCVPRSQVRPCAKTGEL